MEDEYNTILNLIKASNFKKIMIMRNSWGFGSWCIVNKIVLKDDNRLSYALGHIHYKDGNTSTGSIDGANTYSWKTIKIFNEDIEVKNQNLKE